MKHPVKSEFETAMTEGAVRVTFNPTNSIYTFYKLADPERHGPVSLASVRHAGPTGDTQDYASDEVQAIAHRLAAEAVATQ